MSKAKKVLISPLDWGLGHATRCIPIINELLSAGFEVMIGASGKPLHLLKSEFPSLKSVEIPDYAIEYSLHNNFMGHFVKKLPEMLFQVQKENNKLKQLIDEYNIDIVISDNRFGLQSSKIKSIIITHQIQIQLPWGKTAANWINHKMLNRFDEVWVPDFSDGRSLAGDLSKDEGTLNNKVRYLGPLSRFEPPSKESVMDLDFVAIISGPEPQRTILDKIIQNQTEHTYYSGVVIQGLPSGEHYYKIRDGLHVYSHLKTDDLRKMMSRAKVIISRSGYSTIMELSAMGKPAILIPTPGQPEQEYLANHLKENEQFIFIKQKHLNLPRLLTRSFPPIKPLKAESEELLRKAVKSLK